MPVPGDILTKDPDESLAYSLDWTSALPSGETISTSSWTIAGSDSVLTKDNESILAGSKKTQLRLLAGTVGVRYSVANKITTSGAPAQTMERTFYVAINQR